MQRFVARLGPRHRRVVPHITPGTAPGTIETRAGAAPMRLRATCIAPDRVEEFPLDGPDRLGELRREWPLVWLTVEGLGDAAALERLGAELELHRLLLEDVVNVGQRAKAEVYEETLFVVLRPAETAEMATGQVSVAVREGLVVSFHEREERVFKGVRQRLRTGRGRIRTSGAGYLAYTLVDVGVDTYFPAAAELDSHLERLEDQVLRTPDENAIRDIHALKHEVGELQRRLRPHLEALSVLSKGAAGLIDQDTQPYLRDCQDHVMQASEWLSSQRDAASELSATAMGLASYRMNEVMRVLTMIATIFLPLGFITGLYGMNFDPEVSAWNMPELSWRFGYPFALGIMTAAAIGMLAWFRRLGWLSGKR